jgi:DNA-binding HxlR family transcriptional regulator
LDSNCTVYRTMDFIGKRWTLLILLELHKGRSETRRFSELRRRLPDITPKMLSERLKELEVEGLIEHTLDDSEVPVKSMYTLTDSGHEFVDIIASIKAWSLKHKIHNEVCSGLNCVDCIL